MELCPGGSLKSLLNDSDQVLDQVTQLRFAAETALGSPIYTFAASSMAT